MDVALDFIEKAIFTLPLNAHHSPTEVYDND